MDDMLKEKILKMYEDSSFLSKWSEIQINEERKDITEFDENEIGITSNGIRYLKKDVINYLTSQNIPLTPQNVDLAGKMFPISEDNIVVTQSKERVERNELDDINDEDIQEYIEAKNNVNVFKILEEVKELKSLVTKSYICDYEVDIITDNYGGGTNVQALASSIKNHSRRGFKVKTMITNEIGVNSTSISIGGSTAGTNSTIDQIVIVYERPAFLNDKIASDIRNDLLKNDRI